MGQNNKNVRNIIADVFKQDETIINNLDKNENLSQYGMDSITSIDLIVALEEEFNISFNEEDLLLENINSIEKIEKIIFSCSPAKEECICS